MIVSERNESLDTLRTLCAILVITLHTCAIYIVDNMNTFNSNFVISSCISAFTRVSVPVFVVISGRFLLSRYNEADLKGFYRKRLPRLLVPFIVWSLIYTPWKLYVTKTGTTQTLLKDVINGVPYIHLWFFYMIMGLYIITPIVYKIMIKASDKNRKRIAIVFLIIAFASEMIQIALSKKLISPLWFIDYIGYFMFGYAFKDYKPKRSKYTFLCIYLFCGALAGTFAALFKMKMTNAPLWMYFHTSSNPLNIVGTTSLYIFFNNLELKSNPLSKVSKYTLGIYVLHLMVLEAITFLTKKTLTSLLIIDIPLYVAATFFISLTVVCILYRFKFTRKIVQ